MKILENLISETENESLLYDNTLTLENTVAGSRTLDIDNVTAILIAQNGSSTTFPTYTATGVGTIFIICNQSINLFEFASRTITAINIPTTNSYTEVHIARTHSLAGGEVSSTGKRTTAQSERTASGVVFEDVAGYEFEENNIQIPYITVEQYDIMKSINLSIPHFVKFEGEFARDDVVYCVISELTVQTIGLQAGYTMQINLQEAK